MAKRIAITKLNASTIDILNTIRANASQEYQDNVPEITKVEDLPKVGEAICGYPARANTFLEALVNRIAQVRIDSATFNNAYKELKKGYLEFGETVEQVFVGIIKAHWFSSDKEGAREFKKYMPDVRSTFHVINWRVVYPITVTMEELKQAFLSIGGVQDMIARIVDSVYTSAEYDDFLLFKYLLIKSVTKGKLYPIPVDNSNIKNYGTAFKAASNKLLFMSDKYNTAGVKNTTPKERQYIFIDSDFDAQFDVDVLAAAFHMEKAEFMGKRKVIDNWTEFDNERFDVIRAQSDGLEEVTAAELALMADVKAVLVDEKWFQIYDNLTQFTEKFIASELRWNYFYHKWMTISTDPFSNALVFVKNTATTALPSTLTFSVDSVELSGNMCIFTLVLPDSAALIPKGYNFIQTEDNTTNGIAVHKYGAFIAPYEYVVADSKNEFTEDVELEFEINGTKYTASDLSDVPAAGDTITFTKVV